MTIPRPVLHLHLQIKRRLSDTKTLARKWPRKEYPKTHTQPSHETTQSFYSTLSGGEKKKVKEKERAQSRFILSTNFIWNIVVRSSRLSPKGQKLLQLCPMDKVEEKLLESCLCSEKESVLTVRAVPAGVSRAGAENKRG